MSKIKILMNKDCTDAQYNLASEEYLLSGAYDDDILMLWKNAPSVIIGKNQNAYSELNIDFVKQNSISVVRRMTGGGAVFHDLGNLNFTFITKATETSQIDFARFAKPITDALATLGINATLTGRNDICIDGKKISGTAQCILNGRVMHHGTLLFSADLSKLSGALNVSKEKMIDKGVKSVKSRVTNIYDCLNEKMTVDEFCDYISKYFVVTLKDAEIIDFNPKKIPEVCKLYVEKYSKWEWNFGYSPNFEFSNKLRFPFGTVELYIKSQNGIISSAKICGDFFGKKEVSELSDLLVGSKFEILDIRTKISEISINDYIFGCQMDDFIQLFSNCEVKNENN